MQYFKDSAYVRREFYSDEKEASPICKGFAKLFCDKVENFETKFCVPEEWGVGGSRRVRLGNTMELCFNDMRLCSTVQLAGKTKGNAYILLLCTGDGAVWQEKNSHQFMGLEKNAGMLYQVGNVEEIGIYEKNFH